MDRHRVERFGKLKADGAVPAIERWSVMQQEQPRDPKWLEWVIYPFGIAVAHFFALFILSLFFAYRAPWVLYPLGLFAMIAEGGLSATTSYKGQDSLQWPIILANSALYGFGIYWVYRRFRRTRPAAAAA